MEQGRIQAVIARYREDVAWADSLAWPCLVYDKSGEPGVPDDPGVRALPNVGREAHTYLHHILAHYPDFPDYTVFLQADPFTHLETPTLSGLHEAVDQAVARGVKYKGLAWYRIRCDGLGRPHDMHEEKARRWAGYGRDIPVAALFERLFAGPAPREFVTGSPAGLLLVHRERIVARPRALYELAMGLVLADPGDAWNTGHAFERLWHLIFNGNARLARDDYRERLQALDKEGWPA